MGGLDGPPKPPLRSSRLGGAAALLDHARGPRDGTQPPRLVAPRRSRGAPRTREGARDGLQTLNARRAPAEPWRSSNTRRGPRWPPNPQRSSRLGGAAALLEALDSSGGFAAATESWQRF